MCRASGAVPPPLPTPRACAAHVGAVFQRLPPSVLDPRALATRVVCLQSVQSEHSHLYLALSAPLLIQAGSAHLYPELR